MLIQTIKENSMQIIKKKNDYRQLHWMTENKNERHTNDSSASKISFTAYRGADFYGAPSNRQALDYKVELTPIKINKIMERATSTDEGLITVYKALIEESKHINDAFMGMSVITKQFLFMSKDQIGKIRNDHPKLSRTPFVGAAFQALSKLTGGFMDRITGYSDDLIEDYNQIVEKYFHNGVNKMIKDYVEVSKYTENGIKYVNMRKGESPLRADLLTGVSNSQKMYTEQYKELSDGLTTLAEKLSTTTTKVLEEQNKRQNKRLAKKVLIKIVTLGLG